MAILFTSIYTFSYNYIEDWITLKLGKEINMNNKKRLDDSLLDEVNGGLALDSLAQKTDLMAQKIDMMAQKTDLMSQKSNLLDQKTDLMAQKNNLMAKKTDLLAQKTAQLKKK